jgi:Fe-S-cluster containining protein
MSKSEKKAIFNYLQQEFNGRWEIRNSVIIKGYGNITWEWTSIDQYDQYSRSEEYREKLWIWMEYCVMLDDTTEEGIAKCMIHHIKPRKCVLYTPSQCNIGKHSQGG